MSRNELGFVTPALTAEGFRDVPEVLWIDPRISTHVQSNGAAKSKGEKSVQFSEQDDWRTYAHCLGLDTNIFYPTDGAGVKNAKTVCAECPVIEPCLEQALSDTEQIGVWGGTSERERRRILKSRQTRNK